MTALRRIAEDLGVTVRELVPALVVAPLIVIALWAAMVLTFAFGEQP